MLRMRLFVAALALLSVAAAPDLKTRADWQLVDPKSGECRAVRAMNLGGPQSYIDYMRRTGHYGGQKILRAPDGSVAVVVVMGMEDDFMEFYASHEICEIGKQYWVNKGVVPGSPNELR